MGRNDDRTTIDREVRTLAAGAAPSWSLVVEVVLREAAIAFPFALWAGYVFGRVLTYFFRRASACRNQAVTPSSPDSDLPPTPELST